MKQYIKLTNVVDIRTGNFHSVAVVKEQNVRWFIPVEEFEVEE